MAWGARRRSAPLLSIVIPAYDVAAYLPACLDSVLGQDHRELEVVVVDDGSPDKSGEIAEQYAARDARVRVVHTANQGLGAARNEGVRLATGSYLGFADSDDVVPPAAYSTMLASLEATASDLATGSIVRWEADGLHEPPWMRRLHNPPLLRTTVAEHPEILGDVFAWNKLYRRSAWDAAALSWPEGVRYEDQPTTTKAFLAAGGFDVLPDVVYHWRIRADGTSITQQRSSVRDLTDRLATKRMALTSVEEYVAGGGDPHVLEVFRDRVLAGDLHRYFTEIPGCSDEWWALLRGGIADLFGSRSLTHSGLTPVHRLTGWLVEQDRRDDAVAVMSEVAIDLSTVDPAALALRPHETQR